MNQPNYRESSEKPKLMSRLGKWSKGIATSVLATLALANGGCDLKGLTGSDSEKKTNNTENTGTNGNGGKEVPPGLSAGRIVCSYAPTKECLETPDENTLVDFGSITLQNPGGEDVKIKSFIIDVRDPTLGAEEIIGHYSVIPFKELNLYDTQTGRLITAGNNEWKNLNHTYKFETLTINESGNVTKDCQLTVPKNGSISLGIKGTINKNSLNNKTRQLSVRTIPLVNPLRPSFDAFGATTNSSLNDGQMTFPTEGGMNKVWFTQARPQVTVVENSPYVPGEIPQNSFWIPTQEICIKNIGTGEENLFLDRLPVSLTATGVRLTGFCAFDITNRPPQPTDTISSCMGSGMLLDSATQANSSGITTLNFSNGLSIPAGQERRILIRAYSYSARADFDAQVSLGVISGPGDTTFGYSTDHLSTAWTSLPNGATPPLSTKFLNGKLILLPNLQNIKTVTIKADPPANNG